MKRKEENKRALIVDAMEALIKNGLGASCTVSEIAKTAKIGKGNVYYYFKSKEEIETALVERTYRSFADNCKWVLDVPLNALEKMILLCETFFNQSLNSEIDAYVHLLQNAELYKKMLDLIVVGLAPLASKILEQGHLSGELTCTLPDEYAHIIFSVITYLVDPLFTRKTIEEARKLLIAFSGMMEASLKTPENAVIVLSEKLLEYLLGFKRFVAMFKDEATEENPL